MAHGPAATAQRDPAVRYKMRLGVWMFAFYSVFYGGFVLINLYAPLLMERTVLRGLNLATVYGFALIIVALIEALIYDRLCHRQERLLTSESSQGKAR